MKKDVKGKIITVASLKGGVGKTITTLNLAGVYSYLGYKTLVIDLDFYSGAVSTYVNSSNDKTISDLIYDLSGNNYEKLEDYFYSYNENIDVLSAPKDPRTSSKIEDKYIPIILNNAVYKYDVILIDTNSVLDKTTITALDSSDKILYMFTNDTFDIKNTSSFISIMKDIGYKNYYMLLNESILVDKSYYSLYEIRNLIKNNIDFSISKTMHVKKIDKFILEGILILNKNISYSKKDIDKFKNMALKLIEKEGAKNA